ncbi:hypothetical protein HDV02_005441, partial [Globomyces sp. JEL0801]
MTINPIFYQLLLGSYDKSSPLHLLNHDCLALIFDYMNSWWKEHINTNAPAMLLFPDKITFPEPLKDENGDFKTVSINMMPFYFGIVDESWPIELTRYKDMIWECIDILVSEHGLISYLTIHECYVEPEKSQRRPGLHTESPGWFRVGKGVHEYMDKFVWGAGFITGEQPTGGILMASNVHDSCRVWDAQLQQIDSTSIIGELGNIEHLRNVLGPNYVSIPANQFVWMTDLTPHESVPLQNREFRQYFRIVTSEISGWYEEHSTPNP